MSMDEYLLANTQKSGFTQKPNSHHLDYLLLQARKSYLKSEVKSPNTSLNRPFMLTDNPDLNSARGYQL
jgi:hypothetical protein